jgi:RND family efflux transporter MFP subunit
MRRLAILALPFLAGPVVVDAALAGGIGMVGAAASLTACRRAEPGAAASEPARDAGAAIRVRTAPAGERTVPEYLTLTGTLRADSESDIAADVSGKVVQTFVERGQPVKRGQLIAVVDSRGAAFAATAASAQARVAQSQLEEARRDCERVKHLLDTGAISQADYDRQTATCTAQQWSATAAEAQQQTATKLLGDANIRAPFDGLIGERYVSVGQYVEPSTRVASEYTPNPLRLQLTVPEANVGAVKQDMSVKFTVTAFGEEPFSATVKYISPNVRESTRDLVIEALALNVDGRLKPGMFAVAKLPLRDRPAPVVPAHAVVRDDVGARVYVVVAKQVQERLVQLGETFGDVVAVTSGVKPGETVVVEPGPDVRDGARVE